MILEGDQSVIDAIKEKKRLMDTGKKHDHIQPLLIIGGGMMNVVYGLGATLALEKLGYRQAFTAVAGISCGAPTAAYFIGGNIDAGARVAWEEACSKDFFNPWRWRSIFDFEFCFDVIAGRTGKPMGIQTVLHSDTQYFVGLSEYETAKPVVFEPQTEDEVYHATCASLAMPGVSTKPVLVNGKRYADGASTNPYIRTRLHTEIPATHVLDVMNQDKDGPRRHWGEEFVNNFILRHRTPAVLRRAANMRRQRRYECIESLLKEPQRPTCFVWGDGSVSGLERDPKKVKATVDRSEEWWTKLLTT